MKVLLGIIILIIILGAGGFLLSSNRNQTSQNNQQAQPTQSTQPATQVTQPITEATKSMTISIANFAFNPTPITVEKGTKVTWTNNDSAAHQIVSDPSGGDFKSNTLQPGDSFSFTFDKSGIFAYHCSIHPSMKASVIVK